MKTKGLVIIIVCFAVFMGVSCNGEAVVSECNLTTKGVGLETSGVTYQYSVVKNSGPLGDNVIDWTLFDVEKGFSVNNLPSGSYTFSVRGLTNKGAIMYLGSKTCFITQNIPEDIIIVLYPQFDESNKDSTLSLNLLTFALDNLTACSFVKSMGSSEPSIRIGLTKCSTGFSSASTSLDPGYYEVFTYIFQNGVEVGGSYNIVMIPTGYSKVLDVSITPRSFEGFVDIANTSSLKAEKDEVITFGWVGENSNAESNGYWIVDNSVVEDNTMYYTFPTDQEGTFTVEYYRGSQHKTCTVTVGSAEKKADVYIMNFRCKDFSTKKICVGYVDKTTNAAFPLTKVNMTVGENFNSSDYETVNLKPVYADNLLGAVFVEVSDSSVISSKYGQMPSKQNTTVKQMIVHGNVSSTLMAGKFPNLETLIIEGATMISSSAFANLSSLTTVYIIPKNSTTISTNVFTGTNVSKVYVVGESKSIVFPSVWSSGNTMTQDDFVYGTKLPL